VAGSKPPLDVVYPYGNRFKRIAAIGVILLRIPTKGRKHVARGETRLTTQQAGSKSGAPASANRHVGGLIIRRQVLAREHGGPPSLGPVCQISVRLLSPAKTALGTPRHFVAIQQFSRFCSKAAQANTAGMSAAGESGNATVKDGFGF